MRLALIPIVDLSVPFSFVTDPVSLLSPLPPIPRSRSPFHSHSLETSLHAVPQSQSRSSSSPFNFHSKRIRFLRSPFFHPNVLPQFLRSSLVYYFHSRVCVCVCVCVCVRACVRACVRGARVRACIFFLEIYPAVTLSLNNRITLCNYYLQFSATICKQLRTIIHNVTHLLFDCPKLRTTRARRR